MTAPLLVVQPSWSWGMLLPSWGYSRCYRCRLPYWARSDVHDVWYADSRGQFALCGPCWIRSTREERWRAHAWVSSSSGWSDDEREALHRAIFEESR